MTFAPKTAQQHTKQQGKSNAFFSAPFIQRKLTVNEPGDAYEQEADAVADKVMRMSDPSVSTPINKVSVSSLQRKCANCEEEDKMQRKEGGGNTGGGMTAPPIVSEALSGSSKPLDKGTQHFMESRMGQDFSNVRIHTEGKAAESAQSVNALAYTSGNNIVFNSGQYQPNTEGGRRLLAHELTHTLQQRNGAVIQRSVKDEKCAVHAYDNSNIKDTAVIPSDKGKNTIGVTSVDDMVRSVNSYIASPDNKCKCVSKLEVNGHGNDGYQSVGNGSTYSNDDKALVHDSKDEHLDKLKSIKFCPTGLFLLMGCHTGRGNGRTLLKKISNRLPGIIIGGAQHYSYGSGLGNKKVYGEGDKSDGALPFLTSPYVNWHLTIGGMEYTITGADESSADLQSKLKVAEKVKVKTPDGQLIKLK